MGDGNNLIGKDFLNALMDHYEAEISKNKTTLRLYLENPAAVADHSGLLEDMKNLTKALAEAEDSLACLNRHFGEE